MAQSPEERALRDFWKASKEAEKRTAARQRSLKRSQTLLRPDEIAGEYDASRALMTSLGSKGGQLRPLTVDDLRAFQSTAKALGKKYTGGITAKQVIDHALPDDRERANRQIHMAMPYQYAKGIVHFLTNAGPESDVTRHHVLIKFLDFDQAVAAPNKPNDLSLGVTKGKIQCSCDCGRWTFWYSYIASIGKFNSGIQQQNYPKIRNPKLVGVACKHVLRVMNVISTPIVRQAVNKMIEAARRSEAHKVIAVTKKDAQDMAKQQAKARSHKRSKVETTEERRDRLAAQRRVKAIADNSKKALKNLTPAKLASERRKAEQHLRYLAQVGILSAKKLAQMLADIKGK